MKKLNYLIAGLLIAGVFVSCSKESQEEYSIMGDGGKKTSSLVSAPQSNNGVKPMIIPALLEDGTEGKDRGGNRNCTQVGLAFKGDPDYYYCGDKLDYSSGNFYGGQFPESLIVTTDGTYVSFSINSDNGCIEIDGKFYKVGAVIVKGSSAANVYFYDGGTTGDSGLASPINKSGSPAGLSNLSFCFIECEPESEIIAIKALYWPGATDTYVGYTWTSAVGSYIFSTTSGYWCNFMGINDFPGTTSFNLHKDYSLSTIIGEVIISEDEESYYVTVELNEGLTLDKTYVYIGSESGLLDPLTAQGCPDYTNWPYQDYTDANSVTFTIPK